MLIENNALLLVIIFVCLSAVAILVSFGKQLLLATRNKIAFSNFKHKSRYFSLKPNLPVIIGTATVFIYGVVLTILISFSNVIRIYLFATIPFLLVLVFVIIYEFTITKKNRDLSYFSKQFDEINKAIQSKEILIKIISAYGKNLELSKEEWDKTIKEINALTTTKITNQYGQTITELEKLLDNLKKQLDSFDLDCVNKFDKSISYYIKNNQIHDIEISSFDIPEEASVVAASKRIREELKDLVSENSELIIKSKTLADDSSLIKLLTIDKKMDIDYRPWFHSILKCIDSLKDKDASINFLFDEKVINKQDILDSNTKGYSWIFSYDIYLYFSKNDFAEILRTIVSLESIDSLKEVLKHIKSERIHYFEEAISSQESNRCIDLIKTYIDLFRADYGFAEQASMYENMGYALLNYLRSKGGILFKKIETIVNKESFVQNKDIIVAEYTNAKKELESTKNLFVDAIIAFRNSGIFKKEIFDLEKCISLYQEYSCNLNEEKISILIMLINSVILLEEKNKSVVEGSINSLSSLRGIKAIYSNKISIKNSQEIGRIVLNTLLENHNKELLTIICRIEKERMSYEKLVRL